MPFCKSYYLIFFNSFKVLNICYFFFAAKLNIIKPVQKNRNLSSYFKFFIYKS